MTMKLKAHDLPGNNGVALRRTFILAVVRMAVLCFVALHFAVTTLVYTALTPTVVLPMLSVILRAAAVSISQCSKFQVFICKRCVLDPAKESCIIQLSFQNLHFL